MRSKQLSLDRYDTDKIGNRYLEQYDPILKPWVEKKITLLEIGVHKGGSLLLWHDYFPLGTIVGIDITLPKDFVPGERIHVFQGSQADPRFLSSVASKVAPEGFDIIIDDASHIAEMSRIAFWHLFDNHLRPSGLYVIEDWGTGYWDDWPDGKSVNVKTSPLSKFWKHSSWLNRARKLPRLKISVPCHSYGMVGFVKELVDEQGAASVTRARSTGKHKRMSKFQSMLITPCIVSITKASYQV